MFENALSENRLQLIILLKTLKNEENMKITIYRNNGYIIENGEIFIFKMVSK